MPNPRTLSAPLTPAEIAGRLTKAQREVVWYVSGRRSINKVVGELVELGLVQTYPAPAGWAWFPTPLGLAVRDILAGREP